MSKKITFWKTLSNNLFFLRIAIKEAPFTVVYLLLAASLQKVIVYFEHTYQIVYIIDAMQFGKPFASVVRFAFIMFVIVSAKMIFQYFMDALIVPRSMDKIHRSLRKKLYKKAKNMDIVCYDNPTFYNDFVFAMNNATTRVDAVLSTCANLISGVIMLFVLLGYFFITDSASIIFVLISFIFAFFLRAKIGKLEFSLAQKLNPLLRRRDYINRIFYLPDFVKELRLSRVKERLYTDYNETEVKVCTTLKKETRKIAAMSFLREYLMQSFVFDLAYLLYLMFLTIIQGTISFGTLGTVKQ